MARGEVDGGAGGGVRGALWGVLRKVISSLDFTRCILIDVWISINKSGAIQFSVVVDWSERLRE
jgi:hypothetical protein